MISRKKKQLRKEKLELEALKNEKLADEWMTKYDVSKTSRLNQDETRALLNDVKRDVLKDPTAEIQPVILERIMKKFDYSGDGQIERTELATAVKKYKGFLRHQGKIQDLFERHDKDNSGELTPDQILTLLTELASDMPEKKASEADVEFVLERCDKSNSGSITLEEVRNVASPQRLRYRAHASVDLCLNLCRHSSGRPSRRGRRRPTRLGRTKNRPRACCYEPRRG